MFRACTRMVSLSGGVGLLRRMGCCSVDLTRQINSSFEQTRFIHSTQPLSQKEEEEERKKEMKCCVVGTGPGGMYMVEFLLKKLGHQIGSIDVFDRLPFPFGLIRYGVAPDHPDVKAVTNNFSKLMEDEKVQFFGNISVGSDVSVQELRERYDSVFLCTGCERHRSLHLPGSPAPGVYTAREFVSWFNGHPDFVSHSLSFSGSQAVVIGNGNVALDVVRILLSPESHLSPTVLIVKADITKEAAKALAESNIKTVHLVGRRGLLQAAWTNKEFKELLTLEDCTTYISKKDLDFPEELAEFVQKTPRIKRMLKYLEKDCVSLEEESFKELSKSAQQKEGGGQKVFLHFCKSPLNVEVEKDGKLCSVVLGNNSLVHSDSSDSWVAKDTGEREEIPCDALFEGIGYSGVPLDGVPFQSGVIPNEYGRVILEEEEEKGREGGEEEGEREGLGRLYVNGWIKRGPSGIVGTNRTDANETIMIVEKDLNELGLPSGTKLGFEETMKEKLRQRGVKWVTWDDWKKIDEFEIEEGQKSNKFREKVVSVSQALDLIS